MEGLSILATPVAVLLAAETPTPLTVLALGLSIVFFGLICIIVLITIMSQVVKGFTGKEKKQTEVAPTEAVTQTEIPNRAEFVAAVTAAIAEDLGQDVSKIRIHSIRRI